MENKASTSNQNTPIIHNENELEHTANYTIEGKKFLVERVFRNDTRETIGTILFKLLKKEYGA